MKTFKAIEKKAQLLGLPMQDMFALLFGLSLAMVLGIVMNFFLPVSKYYFFIILLSTVGAFFSLKRINKNKHPSFLFSYFSYRFWQVRKIEIWGREGIRGRETENRN